VEPVAVEEPPIPAPLPRPASNAASADFVNYATNRMERAELAGLFFQGERDAERDARVTNATSQAACANWAKEH